MDSRSIGGILLITGTSIGAGMLGLPIAAANIPWVTKAYIRPYLPQFLSY
ncbi:aromatic amino acid transport family protein [Legionella jordanis]|nr:aromatic amino acid transport family protein [Legionella jordanis]VEH12959.1 tryptophan/tyrosine permease [Legionella jordanis]